MSGYGATTNREIAEEAGVSTAAIYHYFESKRDLYVAVFEEVHATIFGRFADAIVGCRGAVAQLHAVIDAAVALNRSDPSIAGFVVGVPTEGRRHPDLAHLVRVQARQNFKFFTDIVADGKREGEIALEVDDHEVANLLLVILNGLATFGNLTGDPDRHEAVARGLKRLLAGTLFLPRRGGLGGGAAKGRPVRECGPA